MRKFEGIGTCDLCGANTEPVTGISLDCGKMLICRNCYTELGNVKRATLEEVIEMQKRKEEK